MSKEVIIACDFNSQEKTLEFLQQFKDEKPYVKIGMEVFYGKSLDKSSSKDTKSFLI